MNFTEIFKRNASYGRDYSILSFWSLTVYVGNEIIEAADEWLEENLPEEKWRRFVDKEFSDFLDFWGEAGLLFDGAKKAFNKHKDQWEELFDMDLIVGPAEYLRKAQLVVSIYPSQVSYEVIGTEESIEYIGRPFGDHRMILPYGNVMSKPRKVQGGGEKAIKTLFRETPFYDAYYQLKGIGINERTIKPWVNTSAMLAIALSDKRVK